MRLKLIYILASFLVVSCGNTDSQPGPVSATAGGNAGAPVTSIQWIDSVQDYGRINEGQKLAVSFRFKNSGNKPLVIQSVKPTCGCTVADYPKQPLAPGEEGEITGEFDSNGREGLQRKHITVTTNTDPAQQDIVFEVNVIAQPHQQGQQSTSF